MCFTDESIFRCFNNTGSIKLRQTSTEAYLPQCLSHTVKHEPQVHVWGLIGPYGPGPLKIVQGNLNSQKYQTEIINDIKNVCEAVIFPIHGAIFQQDKAPAHWSASTKQYLSNLNLPLLPWPGNSPDCSPIENVWSYIGQKLKSLNLTNSKQLFDAISELWYSIDLGYLLSLYKSMPNRVNQVIKNNGGCTKY